MLRRTLLKVLFVWCLTLVTAFNTAPDALALGGKLPLINESAPEFALPTNTGDGNVSLADYRGKWLVVYFYPKDFTTPKG